MCIKYISQTSSQGLGLISISWFVFAVDMKFKRLIMIILALRSTPPLESNGPKP